MANGRLANEEAPVWAAYRMPPNRQVRTDGWTPSVRSGLMQSEAPFGLRSCIPMLRSGSAPDSEFRSGSAGRGTICFPKPPF